MYPEGTALENTLLLVVYFKNRYRKHSFAQVFYGPLFISLEYGRERSVVLINCSHFSLCCEVNMVSYCFGASAAKDQSCSSLGEL